MADDAGKKQDQPSEGAAAPDEKVAQEAAEAKAAVSKQEAEPAAASETAATAETSEKPKPKPKPRARKKAAPEAEGTAAAETGVDKDAADAIEKAAEQEPRTRRRAPAKKKGEDATKETAKPKKVERRPGEAAPVVRAHAKYVRTSARKARLVCDHIRGKDVIEARAILAYTPRAVARDWSKLLESAVANAENNHELIGDDLRIASVTADEGPTLKRFRPRAMGRATKIRKRTSHLTITLTPKE
jgi:ribosomal protein L22